MQPQGLNPLKNVGDGVKKKICSMCWERKIWRSLDEESADGWISKRGWSGGALSSPFWSFDVLLTPNRCWQNLWEALGKYFKKEASAKLLLSLSLLYLPAQWKNSPWARHSKERPKGRGKKKSIRYHNWNIKTYYVERNASIRLCFSHPASLLCLSHCTLRPKSQNSLSIQRQND